MEMSLPIVSALLLAPPTAAGLCLCVGAIVAFFAHEPVVVRLGQRGARRARELEGRARNWAVALLLLSLSLGAVAVAMASGAARPWIALPAALAVVSAVLVRRDLGKSLLGTTVAALTFSSVPVPVLVDATGSIGVGVQLLALWSLSFLVGTFAVKGLVARRKDGGRGLRASLAASTVGAVCWISAALALNWPPLLLAAGLPSPIVASVIALRPPPMTRVRTVGLSLAGGSVLSLALVMGASTDAVHRGAPGLFRLTGPRARLPFAPCIPMARPRSRPSSGVAPTQASCSAMRRETSTGR
jgi:hypothetical protein